MTLIRPTPPLYNLPSYYSECESYEEQLQWLLNQLQTLQADVDNLKKDTNRYTDEQIKKLFDLLSQRISNLTDYVNGEIAELKSYVDNENKKVSDKVDNLKLYMDEKLMNLKKYVDSEILEVKVLLTEVENRLHLEIVNGDERTKDFARIYTEQARIELLEKINALSIRVDNITKEFPLVYNPTQGRQNDLQKTINDLYLYLRVHGITCIVFDSLQITVAEFDALKILVRNFDIRGSEIFETWEKETAFSPWTGEKITLKELCYQIAEKINMNHKTASEYDKRTITASEYEVAKTTAYDFDWTKKILPIDVIPIDMMDKFLHTSELIYNTDIVSDIGTTVDITTDKDFEKFLLAYTNKNANLCYLLCDVTTGKLLFTDTVDNTLTQVSRNFSITKTDTGYQIVTQNCEVFNADTKETTFAPNFLLIKKLYGVKNYDNLTEIGKGD
nr:MAG TPA: hypothetical protein [Caudoviricetes sp.]